MEPNFSHHVVEERHDGDPAQPVPLLQLGKQHRREVAPALLTVNSSVADPVTFFTPGSGIREEKFFPVLGSRFQIQDLQPIFLSLLTIFRIKSTIILHDLAQIFLL